MYSRVNERIKKRMFNNIEIFEYKPIYKEYFKKINYEWLKKYFSIETVDEEILSDPENKIIKKGGYIFFAKYKNEIAGTCALLKYNERIYELVKMGVLEKYQGKQIGKKITLAAIEKAKELGADYIYLTTHIRLVPAVNLYKKLGFELAKPLHKISYERKGITMRLDLKKINPN
jgi:GNAT superfamily N-acetyltransferase